MHLADRGGRERSEVELEEGPVHPQVELGLDHLRTCSNGHGDGVVLQPAQLGDDVRRDDVRAGREQLPELDERRAELVEHLAEAPAAIGRGRVAVAPVAPRDEVAEAVPRRK